MDFITEAKLWAAEYNKKLLCTDIRFKRMVSICHHDGSVMNLQGAFLMTSGDWLFCFSEHCGFHIFDRGDLTHYSQSQYEIPIDEVP